MIIEGERLVLVIKRGNLSSDDHYTDHGTRVEKAPTRVPPYKSDDDDARRRSRTRITTQCSVLKPTASHIRCHLDLMAFRDDARPSSH